MVGQVFYGLAFGIMLLSLLAIIIFVKHIYISKKNANTRLSELRLKLEMETLKHLDFHQKIQLVDGVNENLLKRFKKLTMEFFELQKLLFENIPQ